MKQPQEYADERGFASTVGAYQTRNSSWDTNIEAIQCQHGAVVVTERLG